MKVVLVDEQGAKYEGKLIDSLRQPTAANARVPVDRLRWLLEHRTWLGLDSDRHVGGTVLLASRTIVRAWVVSDEDAPL